MSNQLTPTARVILGMLKLGARTGYEIKQAIEVSTRFFWGASYGQIYPELKRLAEAGLVSGSDAPRGGVKRTEYELTPEGERVLEEWLTADDFGALIVQRVQVVAEFLGLGRAAGREVARVEVDDNILLAQMIRRSPGQTQVVG